MIERYNIISPLSLFLSSPSFQEFPLLTDCIVERLSCLLVPHHGRLSLVGNANTYKVEIAMVNNTNLADTDPG